MSDLATNDEIRSLLGNSGPNPDRDARVLWLKYFAHPRRTNVNAGAELNVSAGVIHPIDRRARETLREHLKALSEPEKAKLREQWKPLICIDAWRPRFVYELFDDWEHLDIFCGRPWD